MKSLRELTAEYIAAFIKLCVKVEKEGMTNDLLMDFANTEEICQQLGIDTKSIEEKIINRN